MLPALPQARPAPTGTVFLARLDARGMNARPQSARVAKWQPQRTQNPPPSKGMKVRVLSRALAVSIAGDAQASPAASRSTCPGNNAAERGGEQEYKGEDRCAPARGKTLLVRKSAARNSRRPVDAVFTDINRRARWTSRQRSPGLREIDPEKFPERDCFAETEEAHR